MEELGYDSHNSVLNLGTIAVFSFLYYLRVLYYFLIVKPYVHFTGRGKIYMNRLAESLFFGELLFLAMEAYLEFLISGYLNLSEPLSSTSGEVVATCLGMYSILLTLVVIPVLFYYTVFSKPINKLNEKSFYKKWDGLYEGVRTKHRGPLMFYPVFCARRILFCIFAFYMFSTPA